MRDDKKRKNKGSSYYDGHYPEPEMTLEEIEKILEELSELQGMLLLTL